MSPELFSQGAGPLARKLSERILVVLERNGVFQDDEDGDDCLALAINLTEMLLREFPMGGP